MHEHLPNEVILKRAAGELNESEAQAADAHAKGCVDCQRRLDVARGEVPGPRLSPTLASPEARKPVAHTAPLIGRYRVVRELGRGAMGVVLLAEDTLLGRQVALKSVGTVPGSQLAAHVTSEARAIARLQHPNVVGLYDVLQQDGEAYLAMEFVEGSDLVKWFQGPWTPQQRLELFVQVARGLEAAHGAGVVHRDFKPANVLVGLDGRARVSDFGLATMQGEHDVFGRGTMVGTPAYMAPEQFAGKRASASADQFAFCVALFEAMVGQRPFRAEDLEGLRAEVQRSPPAMPPSLPPKVSALLTRGLAADPSARFSSMRELRVALEDALRDAPTSSRRRGFVIAAAALVVGAVVVGSLLRQSDPCRLESTRLAQVWPPANPAVLPAPLRDSLEATVKEWEATWPVTCAQRKGDADWTRARGCFEAVLDDVEVVAAAAAAAPDKPVTALLQYVARPHACTNEGNPARTALPREASARRKAVESMVALVDAADLENRADLAGQRARLQQAVELALSSGHPPSHARALLARGRLEYNLGQRDDFVLTVDRVRTAALASGAHRELARAGLIQAFDVCGGDQPAVCREQLERVRPLIEALDDPWLRAWHVEFSLDADPTRIATPDDLGAIVKAWQALPGADAELARAQRRLCRAYLDAERDQEALDLTRVLLPDNVALTTLKEVEVALLRARALMYLEHTNEALVLLRKIRAVAARQKFELAYLNTVEHELQLLSATGRPLEMLSLIDAEPPARLNEDFRISALMDLGRVDEAASLLSHYEYPLLRDTMTPGEREAATSLRLLVAVERKEVELLKKAPADVEPRLRAAVLTRLGREAEAREVLRAAAPERVLTKVELAMREERWADARALLDTPHPKASAARHLETDLRRAAVDVMTSTDRAAPCAKWKALSEKRRAVAYFALYPNEVERLSAQLAPRCR